MIQEILGKCMRLKIWIFLLTILGGLPHLAFALDSTAKVDSGNTAWVIVASAMVLFMTVPGLALFYGGMVRRKNILSVLYFSLIAAIVISLLWVVAQYSLIFSPDIWGLIGGTKKFFMDGIGVNQLFGTTNIPETIFACFQLMFAIITVALISGSLVERMNFGAWLLFIVLWSLIVYTPLAHWVWGGGWLSNGSIIGGLFGNPNLNALDFAGGLVVHISSGVSALVAALVLGPRVRYGKDAVIPNNIALTFIGTGILWFGWMGFNAGSALAANGSACYAFLLTNTSAAMAALTWLIIEWIHHKRPSIIGACTGLVAGLVAITPAAGFVSIKSALIIGFMVSIICYFFVVFIKKIFNYDDSLDAFGVHGIGGIWGALATGIFASPLIGTYMNGQAASGLIHGNVSQLLIQIVSIAATILLAIAGTLIALWLVSLVTKLRVEPQEEIYGLDLTLHGEQQL
ncbi:MAG: ammonium transporter [Candidatus Margulisiibacteriota bacterium]|jgi:Amt family ammonium transporter